MKDLIFYNEETTEITLKKIPVLFSDIQQANESLMTINVKGKEYVEVNQRIKAFRMTYPTGFIKTHMISNEDGVCIMQAEVGYYIEHNTIADDNNEKKYQDSYNEKVILATGMAYEKENSTFINKTSYIENCETSAIGRALGIAGFGIDTSIASAEEVQNAIANEKKKKGTTYMTNSSEEEKEKLKLIDEIYSLIEETGTDEKKVFKEYNVDEVEQMTKEQMESCRVLLLKKKSK